MIYHQNSFATIENDSSTNAIIITWLGYCNSNEYRQIVDQAYQIATQTGLKNWIFDDRKGKLLPPEDQKWLIEHMIPKIEASFKKVANVSSEDAFRKIANDMIIKKRIINTNTELQVKFFNSIDAAKDWLNEK